MHALTMKASENKRNIAIGFLIIMLLSFMTLFSSPIEAFATSNANDPSAVDVQITEGGLSISGEGFNHAGSAQAWTEMIKKYRAFIVGIAGIGAVTMIGIFIYQFLKLGASSGNPTARSQALVGCLWSGVAAAGLGAVTIIVGFFYNAFG